eukprot:1068160-Prorocentrum_lima.AAC.1
MKCITLTDVQMIDLVYNMCGNAWSAYQYAVVAMAMTACVGKFAREAGEVQHEEMAPNTPAQRLCSDSVGCESGSESDS